MTVVLGAAATLAAGMVYLQRAQPAWCHWSTPVALFGGLWLSECPASMVTALGWPEVLLDDTSGGLASRLLVLMGWPHWPSPCWGRSTYLQRGGTRTEEARAIAQGEFPWFKAGVALVMIGGIATAASFVLTG